MKAFTFAPDLFVDEFRKNNYVLIKGGVTGDLLRFATQQLTDSRKSGRNELVAREIKSKKKQYLFDLPADPEFMAGLTTVIADLADLPIAEMTLSERHIMVYDDNASSVPPLHKDRFATQIAVGIPLEPCPDARVVLLPHCARSVNPLDNAVYCPPTDELTARSTAKWNVCADSPAPTADANWNSTPVELDAQPGDVVIFAGSSIYHGRLSAAGSAVLYFKFNSMRLDPLGEDPATITQRYEGLGLLQRNTDEQLLSGLIELSPRLQRVSRHYTRLNWSTVLQAYVSGEKEFTIAEQDLAVLLSLRGRHTVRDALIASGVPEATLRSQMPRIRRLATLGAIDFVG